jgi:enoyl-CoA hydratase/carnithine racemase
MDFETLDLEVRGDGTALVEIARPEKLNAMNHAFFEELPALLKRLDADPEVAACVLTGAGRALSVGGDFEDFDALETAEDRRRQVGLALGCLHAVESAQTVVVAAVNGLALAGGTELTLACDMAVAAADATFSFREITVGLMPAFGVVRGPEVLGRAWTSWLALVGDDIDAATAERIGLVQKVVAPERLREEALAVAARIAAHPRLALRVAKQTVNRRSAAGLSEAIEATAQLFGGTEHQALIGEFLESRKARAAGKESQG